MHPKFAQVFHEFFVRGTHIDRIAAIHELSFRDVTDILNSEAGLDAMRAAIRVERLRFEMDAIASRRRALGALNHLLSQPDNSVRTCESRRRAADAILRGTKSRRTTPAKPQSRSGRPTPIEPSARSPTTPPQKQPANRHPPVRSTADHSGFAKSASASDPKAVVQPAPGARSFQRAPAPKSQLREHPDRDDPVPRKSPVRKKPPMRPESSVMPTQPAPSRRRDGDTS